MTTLIFQQTTFYLQYDVEYVHTVDRYVINQSQKPEAFSSSPIYHDPDINKNIPVLSGEFRPQIVYVARDKLIPALQKCRVQNGATHISCHATNRDFEKSQ